MSATTFEARDAPSPDSLLDVMLQGIRSDIFKAALQLQVWRKVADGRRTAREISEPEGWSEAGAGRLLDVLCAMDLLGKDKSGYCLVPLAETYLLPDKPAYIGEFLLQNMAWEGHGKLADAIRTGRRPIERSLLSERSTDFWVGWAARHGVVSQQALQEADRLWEALNVASRSGLRILDLACGSAIMTLAFARHDSEARVWLQDWPEVLETAAQIAKRLGVGEQIQTIPGDVAEVDLGVDRFDLAWLGHIAHYFAPSGARQLLTRVHEALLDGGVIVLEEDFADEGRCKDEYPLLESMWLFRTSEQGQVYTLSEMTKLLEGAGFAKVEHISDVGKNLLKAVKS